jgi:hypothetical protein
LKHNVRSTVHVVLASTLAASFIAIAIHAYRLAVSLNRFALNVPVFATVGIVLGLIACAAAWRWTSSLPRRALAVGTITLIYAAVIYGNFALLHGSDSTRIVVERNGRRRLLEDGYHWNLSDRLVVFAPASICLDPDERFTFERDSGNYHIHGELTELRLSIPLDQRRLLQASGVDNLSMRESFEAVMERIEDRAVALAADQSCVPAREDYHGEVSLRLGHWQMQTSVSHTSDELCDSLNVDSDNEPLDPMLTALGARIESAHVTISRTPLMRVASR